MVLTTKSVAFFRIAPVPCPETEPTDGDICSGVFPHDNSCFYGKLCCPGDEGNCIPDKECHCGASVVSCFPTQRSVLCPSVCPQLPPATGDVCHIDGRFDCVYGSSPICDHHNAYGIGYEQVCNCLNGRFSCETK